MSKVQLPEWSQPLFSEDYRYFALCGGRGSAKSHTIATVLIVMAAQRPLRILCTREVQKSIRDSVKRLLDDKIDQIGFRSMFKSTDTEIKGTNGSLIVFAGLQHNIDSIKSMEGIDICWCEEAQTLSQVSLDTLIPTIRKPGSRFFFTWNPKNPKDPVDAMFANEEARPPRTFFKRVNYDLNPWFPDVLREEMEHDKTKDRGKYLHVWEGEYLVRSNANVFQDWRIEDFETPEDAFFRFGCDWGFSVDPTTLIRCFTEGRKLYFDYEAYQIGCEIDDTPALFAQVPESDKWPIIADSASPERISYMRKHGYPKMMKALKGRKSIEEGIAFMQSHEIIVHPRCEHTIEEFMNYSYRIDPITDEITNVLEDKNNHCIAEGELVETKRGFEYIQYVKVGDMVRTRCGWKTVLSIGPTGQNQDTLLIITKSGKSIRLTGLHKILTGRGWLKARDIRYNDLILSTEQSCPSQYRKNLTGYAILGILSLTAKVRVSTTGLQGQGSALPYFIETFGSTIMGQFLRVCTFTTLISTQIIMIFQIWSALLLLSMSKGIGMTIGSLVKLSTLRESGPSQKLGILHQKVEKNTEKLGLRLTKTLSRLRKSVSIVMQNLPLKPWATETTFAQISANLHGVEQAEWTILPAYAHVAKENLSQINIASNKLAVDRVLTITDGSKSKVVYDMTVEDIHEYGCQGVLVGNCIDAARYSLEAVRRTVKAQKDYSNFHAIPSQNYWGKKY